MSTAAKAKEVRPVAGRIHDDKTVELAIGSIRLDGGTQPRDAMDEGTVEHYAEMMREGEVFPPVVVFFDGKTHWLADGFHRVHAATRAGLEVIRAEVRLGLRRDAVMYSVGANARHGLPRSNADKRKAVQTLLDDEEWGKLSNREIARRCGVTHTFAGELRWEREGRPRDPATKRRSEALPEATKVEAASTPAVDLGGSAFHSSPDFDEPPNVQADDPPDVAAARRNGTIPRDVVVEVTEPEEEGEWVETQGVDPADLPPPREMTDAEWLESLPARAHLSGHIRARFDREALAFRAADEFRQDYLRKIGPILKGLDRENKGYIGPWRYRVRSFLTLSGPGYWLVCKECNGTGEIPLIGMCAACHRNGYMLR